MSDSNDTTTFEIPDNATYGDYPITEIGYHHAMEHVYVIYEGTDLYDGWSQLIFSCTLDDGTPVIDPDGAPPGIMQPDEAEQHDTPGANESQALYETLEAAGIRVP